MIFKRRRVPARQRAPNPLAARRRREHGPGHVPLLLQNRLVGTIATLRQRQQNKLTTTASRQPPQQQQNGMPVIALVIITIIVMTFWIMTTHDTTSNHGSTLSSALSRWVPRPSDALKIDADVAWRLWRRRLLGWYYYSGGAGRGLLCRIPHHPRRRVDYESTLLLLLFIITSASYKIWLNTMNIFPRRS